jgi:hypothetical protein
MRKIPLVCVCAGIFLSGCETESASRPVGGGCRYRDIPGTCLFESITPSGPIACGDGFRTLFSFLPDSDREDSREGCRLVIGDGKDPTRRYLDANRIEAGGKIRCIRRLAIRGPCSPEVFAFPGLKSVY